MGVSSSVSLGSRRNSSGLDGQSIRLNDPIVYPPRDRLPSIASQCPEAHRHVLPYVKAHRRDIVAEQPRPPGGRQNGPHSYLRLMRAKRQKPPFFITLTIDDQPCFYGLVRLPTPLTFFLSNEFFVYLALSLRG